MSDQSTTEALRHFDEASDDVARKLIGCLSKAKDSAATPAEVETAMAMAQKLAIKHRIDLSTVSVEDSGLDARSQEEMVEESIRTGKGYRRPPASKYLISILLQFFSVEILQGSGRNSSNLSFIGRSSDVAFAKYAYEYLHRAFGVQWVKYKRDYNAPMSQRNSFYIGVYEGVCKALAAAKEQDERQLLLEAAAAAAKDVAKVSDSYQLMVVTEKDLRRKFMEEGHPVLRKSKWSYGNHESGFAREKGQQAGEQIKVNQPLASESQRKPKQPVAGALA
jgi:hypothetical protein